MATQQTTLTLTDLRPAKGSVKAKLRVGRGRASGAGKTSNRGHNGEGQRSGNSTKRGFEGGQMPGYRRAPKIRRFVPACRRNWLVLNIGDLESILLENETELTYDLLKDLGLLKHSEEGLRLLGNGELKRKLTIHAHHVSESARQKVEAAGGTITLLSVEKA
jgi:large subunit ribosomal protein L15